MDILMVVAQQDFRDEELLEPRHVLEAAGHRVFIASRAVGPCVGAGGSAVRATLALEDVRPDRFDGAVFVGGNGARAFFDDPHAHRVALELSRSGRLLGAICVAPVILARAGVLAGRKVAVFPSEVEAVQVRKAVPQKQDVVIDGKVVTASGPKHAHAFGEALVEVLKVQRPRPTPLQRPSPSQPHPHR